VSQSDPTGVEAWLSRPSTRAEIDAAILHFRRYNPSGGGQVTDTITEFQATIFALGIELLANLEMFGGDDGGAPIEEPDPEETRLGGFSPDEDDDDDDKSWLRKR
jgi:hypothetical protein